MCNSKLMADIACGLKELREAAGLRQIDVAKFAKITLRHYQKIEAGNANPTFETMVNLAGVFDFDITEFVDFLMHFKQSCSKKRSQIDKFSLLEMQRFILRFPMVNLIQNARAIMEHHGEDILFGNKHLLDRMPFVVIHVDERLDCCYKNEKAHEFFGDIWKSEEAEANVPSEEEKEKSRNAMDSVFTGKTSSMYHEVWHHDKDGRKRYLCAMTFPKYIIPNNRNTGIITQVIYDATDTKVSMIEVMKLAKHMSRSTS